MEVILIGDVEKLGKKGDRVNVRDGFFRNFLFPRGKAILATKSTLRSYEQRKAREEAKEKEEREKSILLAKKLEGMTLTLKVQVGEGDKLFGSVTNQEIAKALREEGVELDRRKIEMVDPIKKTGTYKVKIKLHSEAECFLQLKVVKKDASQVWR